MGERTHHPPGTFCWVDLATTDQDAAKAFYSGLFGWELEDMPAGEGIVYTMARLGGLYTAAIAPQPPQARDTGAPPAWQSYVAVEDADAAVARAGELGATVLAPAFDVFDAGRMAVLQDPQGAVFMVWQAGRHIGAQLVNAPGALVWNELATSDVDAATHFYGGLFGWTFEESGGAAGRYMMIRSGERLSGGIRDLEPSGAPPYWLVYFGAEDLDAATAQVEERGGAKLAGPIDLVEMGARITIVQDPQGAALALYAGRLDP